MTAFSIALSSPQTITGVVCSYLKMPTKHKDVVQIQDAVYFLFERIVVHNHVKAVLFVDVDNVLYDEANNKKVLLATQKKHPITYDGYDRDCVAATFFSGTAMQNIQTVLNKVPDLALVLSSQWRKNRSQYQLRNEIFAHWPWFTQVLLSKTDDIESEYSETGLKAIYNKDGCAIEIRRWLYDHPNIKRYAVIDDINNGLSSFGHRFVQIYPPFLFRACYVPRVIQAFNFVV